METIISESFTRDVKARFQNRVEHLNNETFVELWNTYADEERKEYICKNNENGVNSAFMHHKHTECCANIDCFALLTAQSKNLWNRNSEYITIKDDSVVSIDTSIVSTSRYIDIDGLIEWLFLKAKKVIDDIEEKNGMLTEAETREELFGVRAYTLINTTEYNNDDKYAVETKVIEGFPLFNVEGWEFTTLMKMKVSEVVNSEDYCGAMIVRVK